MKILDTIQESTCSDSREVPRTFESRKRLKVLVLGEDVPFPPDSGRRIRTWNLLRGLAPRHALSYLCYGRGADPALAELESAGVQVHLVDPLPDYRGWPLYFRLFANLFSPFPYSVSKYFTRRFRQELTQLLRKERFDLVHCEGTHCAGFLAAVRGVPRVHGTHNIESQIWFRRARHSRTWVERLFFALQAIKMFWFERRSFLRVEYVTGVTREDVQQLRDWRAPAVKLVPNGVDLDAYRFPTEAARPSELLFLGSLDWYPNMDALEYFLTDIFPLIRSLHPDAILRIVGRRPPETLRKTVAGHRHVELVGEVSDVRPHLARAGVVVVPLRIGGGSRLKILEALAAGKPVVSTSIGAEGLELTPGYHFQVADSPSDFAQQTVALISSHEERLRLGENGSRLAAERYGWDGIAARLEAAWFEVLAGTPTRDSVPVIEDHIEVAP